MQMWTCDQHITAVIWHDVSRIWHFRTKMERPVFSDSPDSNVRREDCHFHKPTWFNLFLKYEPFIQYVYYGTNGPCFALFWEHKITARVNSFSSVTLESSFSCRSIRTGTGSVQNVNSTKYLWKMKSVIWVQVWSVRVNSTLTACTTRS